MSSDEERFDEFDEGGYEGEAPKKKKGMKTGTKVLLIILGVCGVGLVVCCGGVIWWGSSIAKGFDPTPQAALNITKEICEIEIPEEFAPAGGMQFSFFGMMSMKMAMYDRGGGRGMLMLMEMNVQGSSPEEMQQQMQMQMRQQGINNRQVNVTNTETRDFEIKGQTCTFQFAEGKDAQSGKAVRQVTGTFPGKGGTAILMIIVDEEDWDEEVVVKMIESIK